MEKASEDSLFSSDLFTSLAQVVLAELTCECRRRQNGYLWVAESDTEW